MRPRAFAHYLGTRKQKRCLFACFRGTFEGVRLREYQTFSLTFLGLRRIDYCLEGGKLFPVHRSRGCCSTSRKVKGSLVENRRPFFFSISFYPFVCFSTPRRNLGGPRLSKFVALNRAERSAVEYNTQKSESCNLLSRVYDVSYRATKHTRRAALKPPRRSLRSHCRGGFLLSRITFKG